MIIYWQSRYDISSPYYGIGFIWTNTGGTPSGAGGVVGKYRCLMGVGV